MSEIELVPVENGILVNDYIFSEEDLNRIRTRILRNKFTGNYTLMKGMSGTTIIRDGDEFILGAPKEIPKESWSYKQWVKESDNEWREYARGTQEEWKNAFNSILP